MNLEGHVSTWLRCLKIGTIRDILLKSLKLLQICSLLRCRGSWKGMRAVKGKYKMDVYVKVDVCMCINFF